MPTYTYHLTCEYDGTFYHGWQRQPHLPTLQAAIEKAICSITSVKTVSLIGAGRTDAGVHAAAQAAHFQLTKWVEPNRLLLGMNAVLPQDIAIKSLEAVDATFHARYLARQKTYCYVIHNGPIRSPLQRYTAWYLRVPLDIAKMRAAAKRLRGEHDFTSFTAAQNDAKSHRVTLQSIRIVKKGEQIVFTLVASRFLRYMVRNIVGILVEVGRGHRLATDMTSVLEARDRRLAGPTAPPHGLCLMKVEY
jgi:tRNA pseudouridine38-40 synthase